MDAALLARLALALGLLALLAAAHRLRRRRRDEPFAPRLARLPPETAPPSGAPLTALVFTSRLCGACHETPGVVQAAAPEVPLVALPVERHGALARAMGLRETPTLLLVDDEGRIRYACEGNPTPEELWTYVREAWDSLELEGRLRRVPVAA